MMVFTSNSMYNSPLLMYVFIWTTGLMMATIVGWNTMGVIIRIGKQVPDRSVALLLILVSGSLIWLAHTVYG